MMATYEQVAEEIVLDDYLDPRPALNAAKFAELNQRQARGEPCPDWEELEEAAGDHLRGTGYALGAIRACAEEERFRRSWRGLMVSAIALGVVGVGWVVARSLEPFRTILGVRRDDQEREKGATHGG
jgi:hypothetical protein